MAKKKTITKIDIISFFMDFVLEHNENPKSVYAFSKTNNFEESKFYEYFSSFEALKKGVFEAFFSHSIDLLDKNQDYANFDNRNKLLSFYYTFFEILTANRSYVIYALNQNKKNLKSLKTLTGLRHHFSKYISSLNIETLDLKNDKLGKIKDKTIEETSWIQLLLTLNFWINDTSSSFEKTDIFIEKSINTSFDVMHVAPLKSVIDFGKFMFKEKFQNH